jgi:hypothetical protein
VGVVSCPYCGYDGEHRLLKTWRYLLKRRNLIAYPQKTMILLLGSTNSIHEEANIIKEKAYFLRSLVILGIRGIDGGVER